MADVNVTIGGDVTPLQRACDRAKNNVAMLGKQMQGLGAALAGAGIGAAVAGIVEKGDAIGDIASRFGVSAEMLQKLGVAAEFTGASLESVAAGLKKMQAEGMAADEIYALADAVKNATTENEAFVIASDAVGKKLASELLPMLNLGGEEMRRMGESAAVMSDQTIASLSAIKDETTKVQSIFTSALGWIVANVFGPFIKGIQTLGTVWGAKIYVMTEAVGFFADVLQKAFSGDFSGAMEKIKSLGEFTKNTLTDAATASKEELAKIWEKPEQQQGKAREMGESPEDIKKAAEAKAKAEADAAEAEEKRAQKNTNTKNMARGDSMRRIQKLKEDAKAERESELADAEEKKSELGEKRAEAEADILSKAMNQSFTAGVSELASIGGGGGVGQQNTQAEQLKKMTEQSKALKEVKAELVKLNSGVGAI